MLAVLTYLLILDDFRNILTLTNAFSIGDENITLQNYNDWLNHLNKTDPSEVESLDLKTCDLETFLDQVISSVTVTTKLVLV